MNELFPLVRQNAPLRNHAMVLLVDDQTFVAEAVRRILAGETDIDFHSCADPGMAVELANRIHPTVILQDLVMPEMDGLDLVRRFRLNQSTQETPIIVLSTKEEPRAKSDAFAAGANDYIVKLPDKMEFLARVRYHSQSCLLRIQRDEAYRALRESQQQLVESNTNLLLANQKLAETTGAASEFLAKTSKEFRSPTESIIQLATLLLDTDLDNQQKELAEGILKNGVSTKTLIAKSLSNSNSKQHEQLT